MGLATGRRCEPRRTACDGESLVGCASGRRQNTAERSGRPSSPCRADSPAKSSSRVAVPSIRRSKAFEQASAPSPYPAGGHPTMERPRARADCRYFGGARVASHLSSDDLGMVCAGRCACPLRALVAHAAGAVRTRVSDSRVTSMVVAAFGRPSSAESVGLRRRVLHDQG